MSLLISADLMHSFQYTIITVYCIGIFYFVKMYVRSAEQMSVIMIGYILGALLGVGVVALDYAGIAPPEVFVEQTRARGFFKDANVFGPFLIPPILILAEELWRPALLKKWPLWLRFLSMLCLVAGLFFSFSRAAWGNLLVTFMVYFLLNVRQLSKKQRYILLWLVILTAVTLSALVLLLGMGDFLQYRASAVQDYDSERFGAQIMGIRLGITNLFGIGPGMMDVNGLFAPHSLMIPAGLQAIKSNDKLFGLSSSLIFSISFGLLLNSFLIDTIHWRHFWFVLGLLWLVQLPAARLPSAETSFP